MISFDQTRAAASLAQMVQVQGSGAGAAFPCLVTDRYRHDGTGVSFTGQGWTASTPLVKSATGVNATGAPQMSLIQRQRVGVLGVPPRGEPV